MTENARDGDQGKAERRAFIEKCGRFAVVTPPVISLMLAVSDKAAAQLATSPGKITTATIATTTSTTNTATNTKVVTIVTTTTGGVTVTVTKSVTEVTTTTNTATDTVTKIVTSTPPVPPLTELHAPSKHADLAMIVDSLGIRKVT